MPRLGHHGIGFGQAGGGAAGRSSKLKAPSSKEIPSSKIQTSDKLQEPSASPAKRDGAMEHPFPLTPALSLGERENRCPRVGVLDGHEIVESREAWLPLPWGEGWGEGERAITAARASKKVSRALGASLDLGSWILDLSSAFMPFFPDRPRLRRWFP